MANRKQYYFIYNGRRVEPGAILQFKPWRGVEEVVFEWYVPDMDLYVIKYKSPYGMKGTGIYGDEFKKHFVRVTSKMDEYVVRDHQMRMESNKLTFGKELQVDGMFLAWLWYIVLMAVTFIFVGRIFYWAVISVCFFIYRYGKLKEEGYK